MVIGWIMTKQNRAYKAIINHREYQIVGPGSVGFLDRVTAQVSQQLLEIKQHDQLLSSEDAAILLAFNLTAQQVAHEELKQKRRKK